MRRNQQWSALANFVQHFNAVALNAFISMRKILDEFLHCSFVFATDNFCGEKLVGHLVTRAEAGCKFVEYRHRLEFCCTVTEKEFATLSSTFNHQLQPGVDLWPRLQLSSVLLNPTVTQRWRLSLEDPDTRRHR